MSRRDYRQCRGRAVQSGVPTFNVANVPGLLADYNPGIFSSLTFNGSTISQMNDTSGTGDANKNVVQATGANQPTYVASSASYNNLPALNFNVAGSAMTSGTWAVAQANPYTLFYVGHTTSAGGSRCFIASNAMNVILYDAATGEQMRFTEDGGTTNLSSGVSTINTPSISFAVSNGVSSQVGVNKLTPNATGSPSGPRSFTNITIGNLGSGQALSQMGPMARALVYAGALTPAQIAYIMTGLGATYGVSIGP